MKKILLFVFFVLGAWIPKGFSDGCNWQLTLYDSYGDGWNGSTLIIKQNGLAIDTVSLASGSMGSFGVLFEEGSDIQVFFTTGSYNSECSFSLTDNVNGLVYSSPTGLNPGLVYSFDSYCACEANAEFMFLDFGLQAYFFAPSGIDTTGYQLIWNFGDGSPLVSNVINPVHVYPTPGSYTVSLLVAELSDSLCADTSSIPISLTACSANGTFDFIDSAQVVDFNTYFSYDTTLFDINWYFGDSLFDSGNPVSHVYSSAGYYDVSCVVTSLTDSTCTDTFETVVPVGDCNINGSFNFFSEGFTATFYPGPVWNYQVLWDFGDGSTSTGTYVTHTYPAIGYYVVTMTLISNGNPYCYESFSQSVYIDGCMANQFNMDFTVLDNTVTLMVLPQTSTSGYLISWDPGDGSPVLTGDSVVYTYAEPGMYGISCTIQSLTDSNCTSGMATMIQVWGPCPLTGPVGFEFDPTLSMDFTFTADTIFSDPNLVYYWDFGDGFFSSAGYSVEHSFANPGFYDVTLYVGHEHIPNCVDSFTVQIEAFQCEADAAYTYNVNPANQMIYYFHTPVDYLFTEYSVLWDFGNGNTVNNNNDPNFTFPYPGLYPVSLLVTDLTHTECSDYQADTINLCNMQVDFSYNTSELAISATTLYDPSQYVIEWDFGDGQSANGLQTVSHQYAASGTYEVCIRVTHILYTSCSFQTCHSVTVQVNGLQDGEGILPDVRLHPNPVSDILSIDYKNFKPGLVSYQLLSITGQVLSEGHFTVRGEGLETLNVKSLSPGMYLIRMIDGANRTRELKFVK